MNDADSVVQSPLLQQHNFTHGFSTRIGGVSPGRYATFNLSATWGDDLANVTENRARFARIVGYASENLVTAKQVHGAALTSSQEVRAKLAERGAPPEADGVFTDTPGEVVGVYTADCTPLLLADPSSGAVMAVHGGWRSAALGIAGLAAKQLAERSGGNTGELVCAIGPTIRSCCFEVGQDVVDAFSALLPGETLTAPGRREKPHFDLTRAIKTDLLRAGVRETHIDDVHLCTVCRPEQFFSYRRDGRQIGQQLSVITCRPREIGSKINK